MRTTPASLAVVLLVAAMTTTAMLVAKPPGGVAATPAQALYTIEAIETWVTAPNGNDLYTRIVRPVPALYPGQRFPTLIAIPGGTGAGAPMASNPGYRDLAARGFVFVAFNVEGRGTGLPGNLVSEGTENCNGFVH
jgi:dipeptidyl aminopeptidase/acylaminoacyl peptidase